MTFFERAIKGIKDGVEKTSALKVATECNTDAATVIRWMNGETGKRSLMPFCTVLEYLGAKIYFPSDFTADNIKEELAKRDAQIISLQNTINTLNETVKRLTDNIDLLKKSMHILTEASYYEKIGGQIGMTEEKLR